MKTKLQNKTLKNRHHLGEIIYRVELPDMEQITLIYLENNDADCKSGFYLSFALSISLTKKKLSFLTLDLV